MMEPAPQHGLTFEECAEALLSANYGKARMPPQIPAWFVTGSMWQSLRPFLEVVRFIQTYGVADENGRKPFRYLNLNGLRYWTLGAAPEATTTIYRAFRPTPPPSPRQTPSAMTAISLAPAEVGSLLDIGCGDGEALAHIQTGRYVGFDVDLSMFARRWKRTDLPRKSDVFLADMGSFHVPERFDCVLAYAAGLSDHDIGRLPSYVRAGGTFILHGLQSSPSRVVMSYLSGLCSINLVRGSVLDGAAHQLTIVGRLPHRVRRLRAIWPGNPLHLEGPCANTGND